MRVYLSSYRLGRRASVLARVGGKALIVMNALDEYPQRLLSWEREVEDLARLGYRSEELDLREYWQAAPGKLQQRLTEADLIWVVGGNAFVPARAATAARLARALVGTPGLTYAGYSAGACLTSSDLRGIDLMDDASTIPSGYRHDMLAETLGLTGMRVVPHAGSEEARAASTYLRESQLEFIELADGDDRLINTSSPLTR